METKIRNFIKQSQISPDNCRTCLQQAYQLMKTSVDKADVTEDGTEMFGLELMVLCAETALQCGETGISCSCLDLYFSKSPLADQYLCRSYLCQAQLNAPFSCNDTEMLERAVMYVLKAISIALDKPRYYYLVYNASVIYWQFCRPFAKLNYFSRLSASLVKIVKALDDIDDPDHEWRAGLKIALIECYIDGGDKSQAVSDHALSTLKYVKKNVPPLYCRVFGLVAQNNLVGLGKLQAETKGSKLFSAYCQLCVLKRSTDVISPVEEAVADILKKLDLRDKSVEKLKSSSSLESKSSSSLELNVYGLDIPSLLLELGRFCLDRSLVELASECVGLIKATTPGASKDAGFSLEVELLQCEISVATSQTAGDLYSKPAIKERLQAVGRCDEVISGAIRLNLPEIIQVGCSTQWNLCMPLLQPKLRHHVRRFLLSAAEALEAINSLLFQLRCQLHTEIAKCEEDREHLQVAIDHIKKAQQLDDDGLYESRLQLALRRMELRSQLYQQPERGEDVAAMIIEQAGKSDSGTQRMKRSLLVKAGQALSPDAFTLVLDGETQSKDFSSIRDITLLVKELGAKARQYKSHLAKAAGHLRRLGSENDRERAQLWGDLCKAARRQQVWDVCRVAAHFCLLYDDGRWKTQTDIASTPGSSMSTNEAIPVVVEKPQVYVEAPSSSNVAVGLAVGADQSEVTVASLPGESSSDVMHKTDLQRMLAEVNFIYGEALIQLLRSEGAEFGDTPSPPVDRRKLPKGAKVVKVEELPDWFEYVGWVKSLTGAATSKFLRAAALGVELGEQWLVGNAAVYLWNYSNHLVKQHRQNEIVDCLQSLVDAFKVVGHARLMPLLVNMCNAVAEGLIQPFLPSRSPLVGTGDSIANVAEKPSSPTDKSVKRAAGTKAAAGSKTTVASKTKLPVLTITADVAPKFKAALDICEYCLTLTDGSNAADMVPIRDRLPLLQTFVKLKHCLQSHVGKTLGTIDESNMEGQNAMTRACVGVELMCMEKLLDFKDAGLPTVAQTVDLIASVPEWTDQLIEMQLWTRLAQFALAAGEHDHVEQCANSTLQYADVYVDKTRADYNLAQKLLSCASSVLGQSLLEKSPTKAVIRRKALVCFVDSARYASNVNNNELVMSSARHFWNGFLPLVSQPSERRRLRDELQILLQCMTCTTDKNKFKKSDESDDTDQSSAGHTENDTKFSDLPAQEISPNDDLSLRATIYGVLFHSYVDEGDWETALKAMDQAIFDMPRTNHRLLIFKHLVIAKATLGMNVTATVQRFQDKSSDYVATLWHRVALCSPLQTEQFLAYQNAIEQLSTGTNTSATSDWLKVYCILELAEWLYCHEQPLQDAVDLLHWAIEILINMNFEVHPLEQLKFDEKLKLNKRGSKPSKEMLSGSNKSSPKKDVPGDVSGVPLTSLPSNGSKVDADISKDQPGVSSADEMLCNKDEPITDEKGVRIGVAAKFPLLDIQDLQDIRQLDTMFILYTVLAELVGTGSPCYADYCLIAQSLVMQIWKVSVGNSAMVLKEMAKQPGAAVDGKKKAPEKKEAPKKKGEADDAKNKQQMQIKNVPVGAVPSDLQEWSTYEVPDEVLQAFKHELMAKSIGISADTILKPTLTVWYLDVLTKKLRQLGYSNLALPCLVLSDTIARDLLKSNTLINYIHLQALQVCVELNLSTGGVYHEKMTSWNISPEEQAKCREEISVWRNTQSQMVSDKKTRQTGFASHLFPELGAVNVCLVWIKMADVLIENCMYKPALELLNEVRHTAVAFEDRSRLAASLLRLARLSYKEAQYAETINLCHLAQETFNGDEMFWFETIMLVVDATMNLENKSQPDRFAEAKSILENAVVVFSEIEQARPNKFCIIASIVGQLWAKLASVQATFSKTFEPDDHSCVNLLQSACENCSTGEVRLLKAGCHRDAVFVMKQRTGYLVTLARILKMTRMKRSFYIQAVNTIREAMRLCERIFADVTSNCSGEDLAEIILPVQRECVDLKLTYVRILVEIFRCHVEEERSELVKFQSKPGVLQILDEITRETPVYEGDDKEWHDLTKIIASIIISEATSAYNLSREITEFNAQSLCALGQCYHLLSMQSNPDQPLQWSFCDMAIESSTSVIASGSPSFNKSAEEQLGADCNEDIDVESTDFMKYGPVYAQYKSDLSTSHQYLMQATESLSQALNIAINNNHVTIVEDCALELVECIGQFDPGLSSQYLALYQSAVASQYLSSLLKSTLHNPTLSRHAALLRQYDTLSEHNVTSNVAQGSMMKSVVKALQDDCQAFKRLSILPQHLDLMKEFPANFIFVVLQHSPDKSYLYGAVLDKPKLYAGSSAGGAALQVKQTKPAPAAATVQSAPPLSKSKARVVRAQTDREVLHSLIQRWRSFKTDVMQMLLRAEFKCSILAQHKQLFATVDPNQSFQQQTVDQLTEEERAYNETQLCIQFLNLLRDLENHLQPITSELDSILSPPPVSQTSATSPRLNTGKGGAVEEPTTSNYTVVLLADSDLLELPLEALTSFRVDCIDSISRDISLQMMHHRLTTEVQDVDKMPPSRIPGAAAETVRKPAGKGAADKAMPPAAGTQLVDVNLFKYIVDPHQDACGLDTVNPIPLFRRLLEDYSQPFTSNWRGILGDGHSPSPGEYEIYLRESGAFLFYGTERLLDYIPPHKVASMNLANCRLAIVLDQTQTSTSFSRQAKVDVDKTSRLRALERPVETAMLMSLAGVKCYYGNQWNCSLKENASKIETLMKGFRATVWASTVDNRYDCAPTTWGSYIARLRIPCVGVDYKQLIVNLLVTGKTTGQTVCRLFDPLRSVKEEQEAAKAKEAEEQAKATAAKTKNEKPTSKESPKKGQKELPKKESKKSVELGRKSVDSTRSVHSAALSKSPDEEQCDQCNTQSPVVQTDRNWYSLVCYGLPNILVGK